MNLKWDKTLHAWCAQLERPRVFFWVYSTANAWYAEVEFRLGASTWVSVRTECKTRDEACAVCERNAKLICEWFGGESDEGDSA